MAKFLDILVTFLNDILFIPSSLEMNSFVFRDGHTVKFCLCSTRVSNGGY